MACYGCHMALRFLIGALALMALLIGTTFFAPEPAQPARPSALSAGPAGILERRLQHVRGRDPAQELALHTSAGHLYRDRGLYAQAAAHYAAARVLAAPLGPSFLAAALRDSASADLPRGRLLEAQRTLEEALELSGEAATLRALGNVLRARGHLDAALEAYARARRALQGSGASDLALAALQAELGEAHCCRGDLAQAGEHLGAAVRSQELAASGAAQGPRLELAVSRSRLASVHHWRGDVAKALELYDWALQLQNETLRADHPDLVATAMGRARALRDSGRMAEALQALEASEAALRRGALEGPDLSRLLLARADLLREEGRLEEALSAASEGRQLQDEVFADANPEIAGAHNVLGSILHDRGLLAEAVQQYTLALNTSLLAGGELHPETAAAHNSLGTAYADAGDDEAAEQHYRACLKIQQRTMPVDSADIATSYNNLATVLYRRGALLEASELLRRALVVMDQAKVPTMNPERRFYEQSLQRVIQELENPQLVEAPGSDVMPDAMSRSAEASDDEPRSFAIE